MSDEVRADPAAVVHRAVVAADGAAAVVHRAVVAADRADSADADEDVAAARRVLYREEG